MTIATWQAVHTFWFGDLDSTGMAGDEIRKNWFAGGSAFDEKIHEAFAQTVEAAAQDQLESWRSHPKGWISYLIVCDQFPRNLFRGSARAFAWDERALQAARDGLAQRYHLDLGIDEQAFAYLPFEHSESLLDQYLAVGLCTSLRDHAPQQQRQAAGTYLRHAQQHRDTILQYGRFPYRNAALGRTSTPEEAAYLAESATPG